MILVQLLENMRLSFNADGQNARSEINTKTAFKIVLKIKVIKDWILMSYLTG